MNGFKFSLAFIFSGVPQDSIFASLLFLLYTNDINNATNYCVVYHFADDTNLSNIFANISIIIS